MGDPAIVDREFKMTRANFLAIADMIRQNTGIQLTDRKQDMVYSRLSRRLRNLGMTEFDQYLSYVETPDGAQELVQLVNALTTNLTKFFREPHHLEHVADTMLPECIAEKGGLGRLRIWSAGCSTGQEPYSIAMTLMDTLSNIAQWDARILATDLDTSVLATGAAGIYDSRDIAQLNPKWKKWFSPEKYGEKAQHKIDDRLRKLIAFKKLNLMGKWPMRGPFDAIFCRNVMIYFDKPTQQKLVQRYADLLKPGGYLYVGHSEVLMNGQSGLEALGHTIYRKAVNS